MVFQVTKRGEDHSARLRVVGSWVVFLADGEMPMGVKDVVELEGVVSLVEVEVDVRSDEELEDGVLVPEVDRVMRWMMG